MAYKKKEKMQITPKVIREFKLNGENQKIRVSLLEFENDTFVDIRRVTTSSEGKDIIKKGISIPLAYWDVFIKALNIIDEQARESGLLDEMYFLDLGSTSLERYTGLE